METVVLNRFESKMWVNRIVLNSLQCNRIIDCGKLWEQDVGSSSLPSRTKNRKNRQKWRFFYICTSLLVGQLLQLRFQISNVCQKVIDCIL